jgi:hypothetical protein
MLAAAAITPFFNLLTSRASVAEAVQGIVDAVLVSFLAGGYLLFVRDGRARSWFRRLGFPTDLALSSAVVLVLFLVGRAAGQVVTTLNPRRFLMSFTDAHLIYAVPFFVIVGVTVQFILQMNRMIGGNVLGYFVAGVYTRPKAEERIFLFMDLAGSTQLAERLGSARYFERGGRPDRAGAPDQGRDLPVRGRRSRHHLADGEGPAGGQLRPLLLPGLRRGLGQPGPLRARLRGAPHLPRRPPRRHGHRR